MGIANRWKDGRLETMMDDKKQGKQKRRTVSAARLYWTIQDACSRYNLDPQKEIIADLLDALKDDNMEAAR